MNFVGEYFHRSIELYFMLLLISALFNLYWLSIFLFTYWLLIIFNFAIIKLLVDFFFIIKLMSDLSLISRYYYRCKWDTEMIFYDWFCLWFIRFWFWDHWIGLYLLGVLVPSLDWVVLLNWDVLVFFFFLTKFTWAIKCNFSCR